MPLVITVDLGESETLIVDKETGEEIKIVVLKSKNHSATKKARLSLTASDRYSIHRDRSHEVNEEVVHEKHSL